MFLKKNKLLAKVNIFFNLQYVFINFTEMNKVSIVIEFHYMEQRCL